MKDHDPVNHPSHYTSHPSGVECIEITRHMNFNCGNAMKYVWRADLKGNALEDLRKAAFYIADEIARREKLAAQDRPYVVCEKPVWDNANITTLSKDAVERTETPQEYYDRVIGAAEIGEHLALNNITVTTPLPGCKIR